MDSSESEDAQSISDKKKLKRNRTTTVSLACLKCKEKHLKCDGAFPCATCRKRNKECIYPEKPYKRGPTRGTIARLEKTINELNDELSKQVNSAKEWERKVFQLSTTSAETRDLLMSGHMVNAQQLNGYINVYMRQYYPWIQIKPPIVDVDQFYDENIDQQQLAVSKSMAMFGALMSTHENHSRDLSHEIRLIISSVFDTTSPYMAAVYFFLSRYFSVIGDFDKEEFYSQNTIMISEAVMKKFGKPVIHGIDLENLRKCAFLTSEKGLYNERGFLKRTSLIYYMNSPDINIVRNIITTMIHNKDKHLAWISGILFQRTWMSLMGQSDLSDLFARVNHNLKLLELIDFIMTYSVSEITKESLPDERIWLIRTDAMRAVFCLFNNYDEAADMFADRVLNQVAKFPPHLGTKLGSVFLYFVPIPVFMLAQVYLFKDERDKFKVALEVLNRYTSEFESVKDGVKLLEVQTEKITNEFPINMTWRLNFFLPKINLFRAATSTRLSADNPSLNTNMPYALATGTPSVSNGTTHSTPTNTNNSNPAAPNWQATNVPSNAGSFPNAGYYQPYNPYTAHGQGNSPPSTNQQQTRSWSGQGANSATNNNGYAYNNNPPGQHNNTSYNYSSSTYSSFKHEPQSVQQVDSNTNQRYL